MRGLRRRRGFTVVELLVVIVVLALLVVGATSGWSRGIDGGLGQQAITAAQQAISDAQAEAVRYPNAVVTIALEPARVVVQRDGVELAPYTRPFPPDVVLSPTTTLTAQADGTLAAGATFTVTVASTPTPLVIDRAGIVRVP